MSESTDLIRLKKEYENRLKGVEKTDRYSLFNKMYLFMIQQRQKDIIERLISVGFTQLSTRNILEVGSGSGGVIMDFLAAGASSSTIHGAELLRNRVVQAKNQNGSISFTNADGQNLPYSSNSFDLVMQFTVFTSILDMEIKENLASEMLRVVKPDGYILWYDFWINPTNPQTRGIRPIEVRKLFPNCEFDFKKITLAPPITQRLISFSWVLCFLLERIKIFNSHYLVVIKPKL